MSNNASTSTDNDSCTGMLSWFHRPTLSSTDNPSSSSVFPRIH